MHLEGCRIIMLFNTIVRRTPYQPFAAISLGSETTALTAVSVVGEVQLGELACDSLVGAENASRLQVALSADEVSVHCERVQNKRLQQYKGTAVTPK